MTTETGLVPTCGWCEDPDDTWATVRVTWAHPDPSCWAGPEAHDHVSWVCAKHVAREQRDLADLGYVGVATYPGVVTA